VDNAGGRGGGGVTVGRPDAGGGGQRLLGRRARERPVMGWVGGGDDRVVIISRGPRVPRPCGPSYRGGND
jgi:hypothetical protein